MLLIICTVTLVATPGVPKLRIPFQVLPFTLIRGWDGMADVAAEWLAARVMRCTVPAAIQPGNRRIKTIIKRADFFGLEV